MALLAQEREAKMKVLFDVVHPAHVHFFKHVIRSLNERGHVTRIVAREKDVTTLLLDRLGLPYETVGRSGKKSYFAQAGELLHRDYALARIAREFKPDVIATRNPAGAQAGRLLGIPSVFDTDNGATAGIHFWSAWPFAHVITTPACLPESYGPRHVKYPGYKQTAYLHPNHFTPDPSVRDALGVAPGERFFLVRLVDMVASHDGGESGFTPDAKRTLLSSLRNRGKVFITHEGHFPQELEAMRFPLPPDKLHDALAFADLLIGDSATMAAEAAVLGTPNLHLSTWAGRLALLGELEGRYGMMFQYKTTELAALMAQLERWLAEPNLRESLAENHRRLLADNVDVAAWFTSYLEAGAPLRSFNP
jgi:predicted glycosyltransferase